MNGAIGEQRAEAKPGGVVRPLGHVDRELVAGRLAFTFLLFQTIFQGSCDAVEELCRRLFRRERGGRGRCLCEGIGRQRGGHWQEHEGVEEEGGEAWTLLRLVDKEAGEEGGGLLRDGGGDREGAGGYARVRRRHGLGLKGRGAGEEGEDHATQRPNLRGGTVTLLPQDFWSDVVRGAAHRARLVVWGNKSYQGNVESLSKEEL